MKRPVVHGLFIVALLAAAARGQAIPGDVQVKKDVVFGVIGGKELKLDVYSPGPQAKSPHPAILRLAPSRETPSGVAGDLLRAGYTLVYAGYLPDQSAGHVFSRFPADVQAAKAAVRWIRGNADDLKVDKQRIGLWGAGHGATVAALVAVTPDRKELDAKIGDYLAEPVDVQAVCLFEGTTDWRNAELYGDELVNMPGSPAYQLFGGNPKEHPDEARQASAVNYIRPTSPATLMVTLASDEQRAMHLIYAETLRKAGVSSALYEEPVSSAAAGRGVDETRLNQTVMAFYQDRLAGDHPPPPDMTIEQESDQLAAGGLYKQARRLIEEQVTALPTNDAASLPQRAPWLRKLRQINDSQQEPALKQLLEAKRAGRGSIPDGTTAPRTIWTIREVLTDPERIGEYTVEATVPQRIFATRADAMKFIETLNTYVHKGDFASADRQAGVMRDIARKGDADPAMLDDALARYAEIRGKTARVWPPGVHGASFANDFGQDLYGYWMDFTAGGISQRVRYVPPGRFTMGSSKEEWGRLPGEPILEQVTIAKGFWLGESVVTQSLWEGVMGKDENLSVFKAVGEVRMQLPAENLSYAHAVNFLNRLGIDARLPTEAEWEYACRAGSNFMYSGTGRLSDMGWFWDEAKQNNANPAAPTLDSNGEVDVRILHELDTDRTDMARLTHPVKQKLPNRWGLYDMQGNVWEWCSGTSDDKPRGYHPARGGSWISIPQSCRAARAAWFPTEEQAWNLGMRICISAQ